MNHNVCKKRQVQKKRLKDIPNAMVFVLLFITLLMCCATKKNLLENGSFEVWTRGITFDSPKNTEITVDHWATNSDGKPSFVISREEKKEYIVSGKHSVKIELKGSNGSNIIDFYQPIKDRDFYKGKKLVFSAKVRCSKPEACQVIMNDDSGTTASKFNTGTDWETLSATKTVSSDNLTYLNFAIRIRADIQSIVYIDNCNVKVE
jgi:hypothetical protein